MERSEAVTAAAAPVVPLDRSYIDWPAVLGGAVVAAATAGLFTAFGAALGLSTISAEPGEGNATLWMAITAFWIVVSLIAAFMAGGYVAGRMRRRVDNASADEVMVRDGMNGLVVWALGTLLAGWMAASAIGTAVTAVGNVAGGVAQAAGTAVGGVAQAAGTAVGGVAQAAGTAVTAAVTDDGTADWLNDTLMRPMLDGATAGTTAGTTTDGTTTTAGATPATPATDPAELSRQTGAILANVLRTGEVSDDERAFLVAATAQRTGLPEAEVEARVDAAVTGAQEARANAEQALADAQAQAEQMAAEAQDAAIAAAETARKSAILTAFLVTAAALIAAAAAVAGATRGGRHRDEGTIWAGFTYRF